MNTKDIFWWEKCFDTQQKVREHNTIKKHTKFGNSHKSSRVYYRGKVLNYLVKIRSSQTGNNIITIGIPFLKKYI